MGTSSTAAVSTAAENIYNGVCPLRGTETLDSHGFLWPMGSRYEWMEVSFLRGWILIDGLEAEDAPAGSILMYQQSHNDLTKSGAVCQRCLEIVMPEHKIGQRSLSSDVDRITEDGAMIDQFMGVYVHPAYLSEKQRALYKYQGVDALRRSIEYSVNKDKEDNQELSQAFTRSSKYEADARNALLNPAENDFLS